ncbi:MAG: exonuclease SbcCD subunit D [Hyphomicrobiaceae bacterium]
MAFSFVHTADWQIGKAFGRFSAEVGGQLRAARISVIDRIAAVARSVGADHVVVAGDVLDSELIDDTTLRQTLGRMSLHPETIWLLLPGNHDPVRPGSIWGRIAALGPPSNVRLLLEPAVTEIAPGVALLPAPLSARSLASDPTAWMAGAAPAVGVIRIGVAHGSVQGFGSLGEAAVPIDAGRRSGAALDYLALGDWHGAREIADAVWYAGTPEPDSFQDNGPGHVLVVRIAAAGSPATVEKVATSAYRWVERRAQIARSGDLEPVEAWVRALGAEAPRHLVSLVLEGSLSAGEATALDAGLDKMAAVLLALDVDRGHLRIHVSTEDVGLIGDPALAGVAARLVARAKAEGSEATVAAHAMQLLLSLETAVESET